MTASPNRNGERAAERVPTPADKMDFLVGSRGIVPWPIEGNSSFATSVVDVSLFKCHKGSIIADRTNVAFRVQRPCIARVQDVLGQKVIVLGRSASFVASFIERLTPNCRKTLWARSTTYSSSILHRLQNVPWLVVQVEGASTRKSESKGKNETLRFREIRKPIECTRSWLIPQLDIRCARVSEKIFRLMRHSQGNRLWMCFVKNYFGTHVYTWHMCIRNFQTRFLGEWSTLEKDFILHFFLISARGITFCQ